MSKRGSYTDESEEFLCEKFETWSWAGLTDEQESVTHDEYSIGGYPALFRFVRYFLEDRDVGRCVLLSLRYDEDSRDMRIPGTVCLCRVCARSSEGLYVNRNAECSHVSVLLTT